jgi:hypothetical protein
MRKSICLVAIGLGTPTACLATDLHLICGGGGSANRVSSSSIYAQDSNGNSGTATITSNGSQGFEDQVNVEIVNGAGRIRLPRTMLPPVHGGEDGWMRLTDIHETPNEITAKAVVNFMSHPNIRIDRISGTISISGRVGQFSGSCEAYDPEQVRRRF